jgi:hypothetical protein
MERVEGVGDVGGVGDVEGMAPRDMGRRMFAQWERRKLGIHLFSAGGVPFMKKHLVSSQLSW